MRHASQSSPNRIFLLIPATLNVDVLDMIDTLHQYSDVTSEHTLGASSVIHNSGSRVRTADSLIVDNIDSVGRHQSLSTYHTAPTIQQVNAITAANQEAVGSTLEQLAELWTI